MPVPATKASASQVWRQMSLRILTFMGVHTTCTRSHWQVPKVMPYCAVWRDQHSESERCDAADGDAHVAHTLAITAAPSDEMSQGHSGRTRRLSGRCPSAAVLRNL